MGKAVADPDLHLRGGGGGGGGGAFEDLIMNVKVYMTDFFLEFYIFL